MSFLPHQANLTNLGACNGESQESSQLHEVRWRWYSVIRRQIYTCEKILPKGAKDQSPSKAQASLIPEES